MTIFRRIAHPFSARFQRGSASPSLADHIETASGFIKQSSRGDIGSISVPNPNEPDNPLTSPYQDVGGSWDKRTI
jgi:hypothetical protein